MELLTATWRRFFILAAAAGLLFVCPAQAETTTTAEVLVDPSKETVGVTKDEIVIGSIVALSGRMADYGKAFTDGARIYFDYVNSKGGVYGRKIKLIMCDHQYDPEKTIQCFNSDLKDKVFAGAFFHGSSCVAKLVRMGELNKMPLLGYLVGTPAAYEFRPTQFVVRPSYKDEVQRMVEQLVKHKIDRIALIYQNDAFGAACLDGMQAGMKKFGLAPVAEASYSRDKVDIEDAFNKVRNAEPQALLIGASDAGMVKIIKKINETKWNVMRLAISSNTDPLTAMGPPSEGFIISQVLPPLSDKLPTFALYHKLDKNFRSNTAHVREFESFLNAMVIVEALRKAGPELTRTKFIRGLESLKNYDLGIGPNYKVNFDAHNHIGLTPKGVSLAHVIAGSHLEPMTEADWNRMRKDLKK